MSKPKRRFFRRFLFGLNSFVALLLLCAYLLPFIPPQMFPILSVLSLGLPVLLLCNTAFLIYWMIQLKREFLLSLIILLLGITHILALYNFDSREHKATENELTLLSYNVRQFNRFDWIKSVDVPGEIREFIYAKSPDIISFQEYFSGNDIAYQEYAYQYIKLKSGQSGQAIFSKFPMINKQSLDFKNTTNNAIYADIVVNKDTVRVFNIHLESLHIHPSMASLEADKGEKMVRRMSQAFKQQQQQVELLKHALAQSPYRNIVCGDLNNSAFSYVYRELSEELQDAFTEAGTGFGSTFHIGPLPLRIDVFLVDPAVKITYFETFDLDLSDHAPIMTRVSFKD